MTARQIVELNNDKIKVVLEEDSGLWNVEVLVDGGWHRVSSECKKSDAYNVAYVIIFFAIKTKEFKTS